MVELGCPKILLDGAGVVEPNRFVVAGGWAGVPGVCEEPPPKPVKPPNAGLDVSALLSSVLLPNMLPLEVPVAPPPNILEELDWLPVLAAGVGVCPNVHPDDPVFPVLLPNKLFPSFCAPAEPNRLPVAPADVLAVLPKLKPDILSYVYVSRAQRSSKVVSMSQLDG